MSDENESPPVELTDDVAATAWIFALPADSYEELVDGFQEALRADPASPLTGFLEAWVEIERGKQSLLELLA